MVQQPNNNQVVKMAGTAIVALIMVAIGTTQLVNAQREYISAETELNLVVHEDVSVSVFKCDAEECIKIKGFANVEALSGANGLTDLIEQMELWN